MHEADPHPFERRSVPAWLLSREDYTPAAGRERFLDKTIFSLLRLSALIRSQDTYGVARFHVDEIYGLLFTIALIVFLSLSRTFTFVLIVLSCILVRLCFIRIGALKNILAVCLAATIFSALVLLPAALYGNTYSIIMIPSKVFASVALVGIFSHTSRWNDITGTLRLIHVPNIFIFILDITIKYLTMLSDFALSMFYAMKLRSVGRPGRKTGKGGGTGARIPRAAVSNVAGNIFLHSRELSEEMYCAMECRGFSGAYPRTAFWKFSAADAVYVLVNLALIAAFFYLG
ncbi:MAG: energy-coupling factor transporter transmembrane protein EcfT [Clostridiales Family XIII bacterium]|jgi:cobalt/nickel transport system permease protein|nr:energy-coupling factor transporter transmembrane protein EcfT [Clostridiales Family XIII bacterium]